MEDFKGVKFRSPQGMTAEILTKLGASIVVLPGGEVYSALDKGVVDAADWATVSMNQRMGFHEIAKFPTDSFHSMPIQEFTVNMDAWKKLPDDLKALRQHRGARMDLGPDRSASPSTTCASRRSWRRRASRRRWADAEMAKIRALAQKTWEEWSKKTPLAKQAYDSQLAWLKDLGVVA